MLKFSRRLLSQKQTLLKASTFATYHKTPIFQTHNHTTPKTIVSTQKRFQQSSQKKSNEDSDLFKQHGIFSRWFFEIWKRQFLKYSVIFLSVFALVYAVYIVASLYSNMYQKFRFVFTLFIEHLIMC